MTYSTKKLIALLLVMFAPAIGASAESGHLIQQSDANIADQESLQRGAKYFNNYCLSCHSLKYLRYSRMAEDLGLTEEQVMGSLNFTGAKFGDAMTAAMTASDGEKWFGKAPPDLSLVTRVKHGGADWVYSYLKSFYADPKRPLGWNNPVFPGASMPHVLWELQGTQAAVFDTVMKDVIETDASGKKVKSQVATQEFAHFELIKPGTLNAQEYNQVIRDIAAFLAYVGEPVALQRKNIGWKVLLFLSIFTFIAWLLKVEYWKDVH